MLANSVRGGQRFTGVVNSRLVDGHIWIAHVDRVVGEQLGGFAQARQRGGDAGDERHEFYQIVCPAKRNRMPGEEPLQVLLSSLLAVKANDIGRDFIRGEARKVRNLDI